MYILKYIARELKLFQLQYNVFYSLSIIQIALHLTTFSQPFAQLDM